MTTSRRALSKTSAVSARMPIMDLAQNREVKFTGASLAKVTTDGVFEGYASLFNVVDLGRDEVVTGAFRECLAQKGAGAIKLLWQHDPSKPLGIWQEIAEDHRGLRVRGKLDLNVAKAREVHALMTSGAIDGLSIGFKTERARQNKQTGVRFLEKLDLWEISVVTFPMLPGARISSATISGVKRMQNRAKAAPETEVYASLSQVIKRTTKRLAQNR
jgi:uncharacterized protein